MCWLLALLCAAAVGLWPLFVLARSLNLQFVRAICSHEPDPVGLARQLEVILLQSTEGFGHTAGLNLSLCSFTFCTR